jgi:hypothetical protein
MAIGTPAEKKLLAVCKETLDAIIGRWTSEADKSGEVMKDRTMIDSAVREMMIDSAVNKMLVELLKRRDTVLVDVKDIMPLWREAYRYAVDAYFRIYLGYTPRKRGRPPLPPAMLRELYEADRKGKSVGDIMIARRIDPNDHKAYERIRGQIRIARKFFGSGNNSDE